MSYFRRPSDPHPSSASFFPTFLSPSLPFRRKSRHNSSDSTSSTTSTTSALSTTSTSTSIFTSSTPFPPSSTPAPPSTSPILPPTSPLLSGHTSRLHCSKCSTDLCLTSQIISKGFTGRHGRAYLVQGTERKGEAEGATCLPNTWLDRPVPRNLVTGLHTVSDVSCRVCGSVLGWKYVEAAQESQKYKVGKFILETKRIRVGVNWENDEEINNLEPIDEQFDSQDEDECEDLFAGVWSPKTAMKRRERREWYGARGRVGSGSRSGSLGRGGGARSEDTFS